MHLYLHYNNAISIINHLTIDFYLCNIKTDLKVTNGSYDKTCKYIMSNSQNTL